MTPAVTKLHPQTLEVTYITIEKGHGSPSQKGHRELPGTVDHIRIICHMIPTYIEYAPSSKQLMYDILRYAFFK